MAKLVALAGVLALLVAASLYPHATGSAPLGEFEVTSQSYLGYAQLTVAYNATATASVGTDLAVTATVSVDNLTGSEQYIRDYVLVATLLCDDRTVNSSLGSPVPTQRYLYPGARWGPLNFSIPITEGDTGLAPGQTANASLTLDLITDVSYDSPGLRLSGYAPVYGEGSVFVTIHDPGTPTAAVGEASSAPALPVVPSVLVAAGLCLLAIRLAAFRRAPQTPRARPPQ